MALKNLFGLIRAKRDFLPENTDFDHLYSEYLARAPATIPDGRDKTLIAEIYSRRTNSNLSWNDIYTFELTLLKYLPLENLRHKIISLRSKYQSIAGQKTYDAYVASKPPDLTTQPPGPADPNYPAYLQSLGGDARYLLDQVYLIYAAVPARQGLSEWLTVWSALLLILLLAVIFILFLVSAISERRILLPIGVVFLAGAAGGFISMLQRLQTTSADGDPVYNLSTFWHGAYNLFLSPLTGAIFAVLLYFMFTGNILQGQIFPKIADPTPTPAASPSPTPNPAEAASAKVSPTASPQASPVTTPAAAAPTASPASTPPAGPSPSATPVRSASPLPTATTSPTATPSRGEPPTAQTTPSPQTPPAAQASPTPSGDSISLKDFLTKSGPGDAKNYALLLVWCFIAGFAERFIPDTLTRLADQGEGQSGGKTS